MVGVFQFFGVSFVFWTCVSVLRFIFETLRELRDAPRSDSQDNRMLASFGGVGVSVSLFWLIFSGFCLGTIFTAEPAAPAVVIATFIIWLACIGMGAYLASRIYIYEPHLVSAIVGVGAMVAALLLFVAAGYPIAPALESFWRVACWAIATLLTSLLGGRIAMALNVLEETSETARLRAAAKARVRPEQVAIVIAAHNEELTIGTTVRSVLQFARPEHIYVGSDGSSDNTVEIVRSLGAHADDITPNRGKAGAIEYVLAENNLLDRYKAVLLMDADFDVDKHFFKYALPRFDDPGVAAVAGHQVSYWSEHYLPQWHLFFTAYRIRLWRILQFCVRYGQTWKYLNISPIIPGGCSVYRTSALKKIQITAPGLVIEDFNMTFNVHHKQLGSIVFDPRAFGITQEPFSLRDYKKQTYRWSLGFFQTIRHHGVWPSWFFFATAFFTLEMVISSALFILLPFASIALFFTGHDAVRIPIPFLDTSITLFGFILSVFVFDYITTIIVALIERKPVLLFYGPGFFILRYLEALWFFKAMVLGLFTSPKAEGKWKSPTRVAYHAPQGSQTAAE